MIRAPWLSQREGLGSPSVETVDHGVFAWEKRGFDGISFHGLFLHRGDEEPLTCQVLRAEEEGKFAVTSLSLLSCWVWV